MKQDKTQHTALFLPAHLQSSEFYSGILDSQNWKGPRAITRLSKPPALGGGGVLKGVVPAERATAALLSFTRRRPSAQPDENPG